MEKNLHNIWNNFSQHKQQRILSLLNNNNLTSVASIDQYLINNTHKQIKNTLIHFGGANKPWLKPNSPKPSKTQNTPKNNLQVDDMIKDLNLKIENIRKQRDDLITKMSLCDKKIKDTEVTISKITDRNKILGKKLETKEQKEKKLIKELQNKQNKENTLIDSLKGILSSF